MTKRKNEDITLTMSVTIGQFLKIVPHIVDARYPILIRGRHGIGKSEIVKQLTTILPKHMGLDIDEMTFVDRRLSQCADAGDIVGVPVVRDSQTFLNPMSWYHKVCVEPSILLLDEVDRAQQDVKQAIFELGDSRKISGFPIHKDTVVFACVNGGPASDSQYMVKTFDPAELDRWVVFELNPTVDEWLRWAKNNVKPVIYDFIKKNRSSLEYTGPTEPNIVYPSRRSWKRLSDILPDEWIENKNPLINRIAYGLVGYERALEFYSFLKNYENTVDVEDIIKKGNFSVLKNLSEPKIADICAKIVEHPSTVSPMKDKEIENIAKFMQIIPKELSMMFWNNWSNKTDTNNILNIHPKIKKFLMKLYGDIKIVEED